MCQGVGTDRHLHKWLTVYRACQLPGSGLAQRRATLVVFVALNIMMQATRATLQAKPCPWLVSTARPILPPTRRFPCKLQGAALPTEEVSVPSVTVLDESSSPTSTTAEKKPSEIQRVQTFSSPVGHPLFFALGLTAYSLIAYDVFSPDSLHLLQPLDQTLHQTVSSTIDPAIRKGLFGGIISNTWIGLGSLGWMFATATAMSRYNPLAWKACALAWALWIFGVGPIEHDPALMDVLKNSFERVRPSTIHRTFSFPSGHTAGDVMVVGALLFVLLPVVYGSKDNSTARGGSNGEAGEGNGGLAARATGFNGLVASLWDGLYGAQHSWHLWALSTATTIVGRVGADAHWLTDTLAGGALSLTLVSGLAMATQGIAERSAQGQRASGGSDSYDGYESVREDGDVN